MDEHRYAHLIEKIEQVRDTVDQNDSLLLGVGLVNLLLVGLVCWLVW